MRAERPGVAPAPEQPRHPRLAAAAALILGGLLAAAAAADLPLAALAQQSPNASGGSLPVWISAGFGVVGFAVAWRKPRNPLGWVLLAMSVCGAVSEDASFYNLADYRLRYGGLPLGWVSLLLQPGWAPALVLLGITLLLFPDGRPPSPRWRWVFWTFVAVGASWVLAAQFLTVQAIAAHHVQVDAGGNLTALGNYRGNAAWWNALTTVGTAVLLVCWLGSLAAQVLGYRRTSGERRQQLKWMLAGSAAAGAAIFATFALGGAGTSAIARAADVLVAAGFLALPVAMGVAILRYRLFDIDRIISRALAYLLLTGLLVGVYAGIVLLVTEVLAVTSTVAVAGATLAAAALFSPLRRRVQRIVDRRFNRARYDADRTLAAFAARLSDAVSLDDAQAELRAVVTRSLEPAHVSVWTAPPGRSPGELSRRG